MLSLGYYLKKLAEHDLHYGEQEGAYQEIRDALKLVEDARDQIAGVGGVVHRLDTALTRARLK